MESSTALAVPDAAGMDVSVVALLTSACTAVLALVLRAISSSRLTGVPAVGVAAFWVATATDVFCKLSIAASRVSTRLATAVASVVPLPGLFFNTWLTPAATVASVKLATSDASGASFCTLVWLAKKRVWLVTAPVTRLATDGNAALLWPAGKVAAWRTISAPTAAAVRLTAAPTAVPLPVSALDSTSMAFCNATIFCSTLGSLATTVSGSLSSTALDEAPITLATLSFACATEGAAPEVTMASTSVLSGVTGTNGLLAGSSTTDAMAWVNGCPVDMSVPPVMRKRAPVNWAAVPFSDSANWPELSDVVLGSPLSNTPLLLMST
jgi:hypothetical protein